LLSAVDALTNGEAISHEGIVMGMSIAESFFDYLTSLWGALSLVPVVFPFATLIMHKLTGEQSDRPIHISYLPRYSLIANAFALISAFLFSMTADISRQGTFAIWFFAVMSFIVGGGALVYYGRGRLFYHDHPDYLTYDGDARLLAAGMFAFAAVTAGFTLIYAHLYWIEVGGVSILR
jgi:uncharacterized membrane protein